MFKLASVQCDMMTEEEQLIELIKNKLPQLLREDEEFRTLFFGMMVQHLPSREEFNLILERLDRHEQHFVRLEEQFVRVEERLERLEAEMVELRKEQVALREDFKAMQKTIEAMQKTIEAILLRIEGVEGKQASLVESVGALEQETRYSFTDLRSNLGEVQTNVGEIRTAFSRFGLLVESVLRNLLQTAVENWFGVGRVERMELGGREVDVMIRDSEHVILEITTRAHLQDIDKLKVSAEDYERRFQIRPRLAIACAYASPGVVKRLVEEGIELISAEAPE